MKANSDGQGGQYAFLLHSQDSVSQNPPPDVDDQRLTRQRRRRTRYNPPDNIWERLFTNCRCSPEDHAILEAEYKKNPKPDKAARVEIVNRVALGEKEVQVSAFEIQDI